MSRTVLVLLGLSIVSNLIYNYFLPLHVDEAYYWVWTKNPQLSYFDHPPLASYIIKLFTTFNSSEWVIHLGAVSAMALSCWLVYLLAMEMFSRAAAVYSFVIFLFLPLTQLGHQVMTPDPPLLLFWTSTIYFVNRAVFQNQNTAWYQAGLSCGLMLLSKYTGVLLLPALLLFLVSTRHRWHLLTGKLYIALLIAFVLFLPVIIWNWQHDWSSFAYQFRHGIDQQPVFNPATLGEFAGGQLGLANPVFFLALLYFALAKLKNILQDEKLSLLFWPFVITLAFFTYTAMFKKAEANWPAPAYISGSILLGYWLSKRQQKALLAAGIAISVLLLSLVRLPELFPFLPKELVLKKQYFGYSGLMRSASKYVVPDRTVVLSDNYQNASMAWYYLEGQPEVYILTPAPPSNYDYWRTKLAGKTAEEAVYIGSPEELPYLKQLFTEVVPLDTLNYQDKYITRSFSVYKCSGLNTTAAITLRH